MLERQRAREGDIAGATTVEAHTIHLETHVRSISERTPPTLHVPSLLTLTYSVGREEAAIFIHFVENVERVDFKKASKTGMRN